MKILHLVEQYEPSKGGMQEVVKRLSEHMVAMGHDVTVATSSHKERNFKTLQGVKIEDFALTGNLVYSCVGEVQRYFDYIESQNAEVVTFFAAQQWSVDLALLKIDKIKAKKVFVPTGFSGLYDPNYQLYFERMKDWIHRFDSCIFLSNQYQDYDFYKANNGTQEILIPNGACYQEFSRPAVEAHQVLNISKDYKIILHVGSHTSAKGHKEALELFSRIADQKYILVIAGNVFNEKCHQDCLATAKNINNQFLNKRVVVKEFNRGEILSLYNGAEMFLFPSNIECSPIVLYECMASKTPVLCSDAGNSREIIANGRGFGEILPGVKNKNGYVVLDMDASQKVFNNFLENIDTYKKRAEMAYDVWTKNYTWEKVTEQYVRHYEQLLHNESFR